MKKVSIVLCAVLAMTGCQSLKDSPIIQKTTQFVNSQKAGADKPMKNQVFISNYDFDTTVAKIETGVKEKGMTVFAVIDHQGSAKQAGLEMQPAKVIIFGNPKAGTPLMKKDPEFALQLPLKALVTQVDGKVKVVMTDTDALIDGSQIEKAEVENSLAKAVVLVGNLVK